MKYFTALADAACARSAFSAAGLDFDAMVAAKNTDALKTALVASKPSADAEQVLAAAAQENEELKAKNAELEKSKANAEAFVTLSASCEALGFKVRGADGKIADAGTIEAQHKALVAKGARDLVAAAGHPGVLDTPVTQGEDPTKKKVETNLTGRDRMRADFDAQLKNLNLPRHQRN